MAFTLFADIEEYPDGVQITAVLALAVWVVATAAYIAAVAAPVEPAQTLAETHTMIAFTNRVLTAAVGERNAIDNRQRAAHLLSALAAMVTIIALILALREGKEEAGASSMTITLTDAGRAVVEAGCDQPPAELTGFVDEESLGNEIVSFTLEAGGCRPEATRFSLPRQEVVSIVTAR